MNRIEQCPQCSYFAEGTPVYNVARQGVRAGVKFAGKKVLVYIISIIMCNFILPIVGTIPGVIIATILCYFAFSAADSITDSVDQELYTSTPFEFKCSHCGITWKRTYEKGVDITTDAVLRFQKDSLVDNIRSEAKSSLIITAIFGVITIILLINWNWWTFFFLGITSLVTVFKGSNSYKKYEEAKTIESMPISDFRHSPYRNIYRSEWLNNQSAPRTKPLQTVAHQQENTKPMLTKCQTLCEQNRIMSVIERKVKAIIEDKLGVDEAEITFDVTFEQLGADSLDCVELLMEVEKEFGISISDEEADRMETVGDAIEYIAVKTQSDELTKCQTLCEHVAIKSKNELIADVVALLQSPIKNVVSGLNAGGKIHGLHDAIAERNKSSQSVTKCQTLCEQ